MQRNGLVLRQKTTSTSKRIQWEKMDFIEMYSKKQIWVNSQWELGNSKTENATKQDKSDLKWFWLTSGLFLDGYVLVGKFWKKNLP